MRLPAGSTPPAQEAAGTPRISDDRASGGGRITRAGAVAGSLGSAQAAPLPVFFAYVWPAIALEAAGELLGAIQARSGLSTSPSSPALNGFSTSWGLKGVIEEGRVAGLSARSADSEPGAGDGRGLSIPSGAEISRLLAIIVCAALMAVVAFTIGREFRAMHRWPR